MSSALVGTEGWAEIRVDSLAQQQGDKSSDRDAAATEVGPEEWSFTDVGSGRVMSVAQASRISDRRWTRARPCLMVDVDGLISDD